MENVKSIIEKIISDTFSVITNVYKSQKESKFTVVPPINSYIIFPKKADNDTEDDTEGDTKDDTKNFGSDRISEQELRFIFVEQFNKSDTAKENGLFYSIETPTVNFYDFTGVPQVVEREEHDKKKGQKGAGRSANIDLVIFQKDGNQIKRVALIEFKARNPKKADYRKDICKLINEESESDCLKYFIQIINIKRNCNSLEESSTLQNIVEKKFVSLDRLHNEENKEYEIFYWCCNINKDNDTDNPVQSICGVIKDDKFELKKCESLSTEE